MKTYVEYDEKRLLEILDTMDIPEFRKTYINGKPDLFWLGRNLHFKNSEHTSFDEAYDLIRAGIHKELTR